MAIKLKKKEIQLEQGYAVIRQLSPMDNIAIARALKDKRDDDALMQNAIIACSIAEIYEPDYVTYPNEEDYMIIDPKRPDNLIIDPENPDNWTKDSDGYTVAKRDVELTYIPDPKNPHNYMLDKSKAIKKTYSPIIKGEEDVFERLSMSLADFTIIASHSLRMNEPNPDLLGE